jgi:hypothetical protein
LNSVALIVRIVVIMTALKFRDALDRSPFRQRSAATPAGLVNTHISILSACPAPRGCGANRWFAVASIDLPNASVFVSTYRILVDAGCRRSPPPAPACPAPRGAQRGKYSRGRCRGLYRREADRVRHSSRFQARSRHLSSKMWVRTSPAPIAFAPPEGPKRNVLRTIRRL